MYMFDLQSALQSVLHSALIHIKHVHSSVSYQWAIYQKYDRLGDESLVGMSL